MKLLQHVPAPGSEKSRPNPAPHAVSRSSPGATAPPAGRCSGQGRAATPSGPEPSPRAAQLTRGLVPVGLQGNVIPLLAPLGSGNFFHLVDFRQAEFGIVVEEELPLSDGEVVLAPVPELPQVLIVQGVERVVPAGTHTSPVTRQLLRLSSEMAVLCWGPSYPGSPPPRG